MANNSLILKKSEINLLRFSSHIKNNESEKIVEAIFSNKDIHVNQCSPDIENEIKTKKNEWLAISSNEWQPRKDKPIITNPSNDRTKWTRCSLCNTANKLEFYVVNKITKETINIGGTCSTNVVTGEMNELSKLIKNEIAGSRYVNILSEIPELRAVVFSPKQFINDLTYELPNLLEMNYQKDSSNVLKSLKKYLNDTGNEAVSKERLIKNLGIFDNTKNEINQFQNNAKNNKWSLSHEIKKSFQSQPNSDSIVSNIKFNNGRINKKIAQKINSVDFLRKYIKEAFNNNNRTLPVKIRKCSVGVIHFQYTNEFDSSYKFSIDSQIFIDTFGRIIFDNIDQPKRDLAKFFIENSNIISLSNIETKNNLLSSVKYSISDTKKYLVYDLYGSFSEKLDEWHYSKFELLINNWTVYREHESELLYLFRGEKKLISASLIMLFQMRYIQERTLSNLMKEAERISAKVLFNEIRSEVYK